jgi:hypothetical protein
MEYNTENNFGHKTSETPDYPDLHCEKDLGVNIIIKKDHHRCRSL